MPQEYEAPQDQPIENISHFFSDFLRLSVGRYVTQVKNFPFDEPHVIDKFLAESLEGVIDDLVLCSARSPDKELIAEAAKLIKKDLKAYIRTMHKVLGEVAKDLGKKESDFMPLDVEDCQILSFAESIKASGLTTQESIWATLSRVAAALGFKSLSRFFSKQNTKSSAAAMKTKVMKRVGSAAEREIAKHRAKEKARVLHVTRPPLLEKRAKAEESSVHLTGLRKQFTSGKERIESAERVEKERKRKETAEAARQNRKHKSQIGQKKAQAKGKGLTSAGRRAAR